MARWKSDFLWMSVSGFPGNLALPCFPNTLRTSQNVWTMALSYRTTVTFRRVFTLCLWTVSAVASAWAEANGDKLMFPAMQRNILCWKWITNGWFSWEIYREVFAWYIHIIVNAGETNLSPCTERGQQNKAGRFLYKYVYFFEASANEKT